MSLWELKSMMSEKDKKRQVIYLLNMDRKKIEGMDEEELIQTIEKVEEIRVDAVKEGRFLDADNAKKILKFIRDSIEKLKKKEIKNKHGIRKQKLEEDFQKELDTFTELWGQKILSYQEECQKLEEEHLENNKKNLEIYREELEKSLPLRPKDSAKMLEFKTRIEHLVRAQEYKDAHYLQQKAHELEKVEVDKYITERDRKIDNMLEQKIVHHQNEYNSLRKRVLNGLDELEIQRKNEYERIFLKYNNIKKNIESQQSIQSYMIEKSMKVISLNSSLKQYYNMSNIDSQVQSEKNREF